MNLNSTSKNKLDKNSLQGSSQIPMIKLVKEKVILNHRVKILTHLNYKNCKNK